MRTGPESATAAALLAVLLLAGCSDGDDVVAPATGDPACTNDQAPDHRFVDCGNGTVTDARSGLIWLRDAGCYGRQSFENAESTVRALANGECGLTDQSSEGEWRLPTKEQWEAFVKPECPDTGPDLPDLVGSGCWSEDDPFSGVRPSAYWTATTGGTSNFAWVVYLLDSYFITDVKSDAHYVWPVRGP